LFQCSSASRKFLNFRRRRNVGVCGVRFSALQRAENSSIVIFSTRASGANWVSVLFSEPKIPQCLAPTTRRASAASFSALQRAENSSIALPECDQRPALRFQCSSASRKFLNQEVAERRPIFRCVSVLFSEPKIPQSVVDAPDFNIFDQVSVLFSEPKIPQSTAVLVLLTVRIERFSALQRAENSSIKSRENLENWVLTSFSALQRAENSSMPRPAVPTPRRCRRFQCSSASRKFLNWKAMFRDVTIINVSVLFSEPKIPQ